MLTAVHPSDKMLTEGSPSVMIGSETEKDGRDITEGTWKGESATESENGITGDFTCLNF